MWTLFVLQVVTIVNGIETSSTVFIKRRRLRNCQRKMERQERQGTKQGNAEGNAKEE
jgi:heme exporter protein D